MLPGEAPEARRVAPSPHRVVKHVHRCMVLGERLPRAVVSVLGPVDMIASLRCTSSFSNPRTIRDSTSSTLKTPPLADHRWNAAAAPPYPPGLAAGAAPADPRPRGYPPEGEGAANPDENEGPAPPCQCCCCRYAAPGLAAVAWRVAGG